MDEHVRGEKVLGSEIYDTTFPHTSTIEEPIGGARWSGWLYMDAHVRGEEVLGGAAIYGRTCKGRGVAR